MVSRLLLFVCVTLLLPALTLHAQAPRHLEQTHVVPTFASFESWLKEAHWARQHILFSTGLWPHMDRSDLPTVLSDPQVEDGYHYRSVLLETYPGFFLTGTLYYPESPTRLPGILSPHGHWSAGRFEDTDRASVPGRAISLARQGYVVFSYSMIGYNETTDLFPHRFDKAQYQLWGFSAMGLQLWNSLHALDFLSQLPEVDPTRIGMTGASGGGTQTFLLTAIDQRIKVAAPVNMISAHFQGGCICENAPLLRHTLNNVIVGTLAAPRPMLLISTSGDWTVNTPEVEFPAIQKVYAMFGGEDRIANVHLGFPHNYNQQSREAMYAWFSEWLKDDKALVAEQPFRIPSIERQQVALPKPPISPDSIFVLFRAKAQEHLGTTPPSSWKQLDTFRAQFGQSLQHIFQDAPLPEAPLHIRNPRGLTASTDAILITHDQSEASTHRAEALAQYHLDRQRIVALYALPEDSHAMTARDSIQYWTTYNVTRHQEHVREIIAALRALNQREDVVRIDLHALGTTGAFSLLARAQSPFVRHTSIDFNGETYETDQAFLDLLEIPLIRRAGDLRAAVSMIVPASLNIENLPPGSLSDWIHTQYYGLGAGDMLYDTSSRP